MTDADAVRLLDSPCTLSGRVGGSFRDWLAEILVAMLVDEISSTAPRAETVWRLDLAVALAAHDSEFSGDAVEGLLSERAAALERVESASAPEDAWEPLEDAAASADVIAELYAPALEDAWRTVVRVALGE